MAKGLFTPLNPEKYLGDPTTIRFLSSWERNFMVFCDTNPEVLRWASEEFRVPYFNPVKKKICAYIPDFLIKYRNKRGEIITEVVEVKPAKEALIKSRMTNYDKVCLVINTAKWQAARALCDKHGILFRVLTEAGSWTVDLHGKPIMLTEQGLFRK